MSFCIVARCARTGQPGRRYRRRVYWHPQGEPVFQEARAPSRDELQGLQLNIIARLMNMLTRQGCLVEEQGMTFDRHR